MSCLDLIDWAAVSEKAAAAIDIYSEELNSLSQEIWNNPETCYNEHYAHKTLTDFLEKEDFEVERNFVVDTGFRATYGSDGGLNVCVICEYDALPGIGHGCGHNLIAECGVAAGIGIKAALEEIDGVDAMVTILGTPAEEGGAGKVKMINGNAFEGVDVAMMCHPKPFTISSPKPLALLPIKQYCYMISTNHIMNRAATHMIVQPGLTVMLTISFNCKPAHGIVSPWEGSNALDAAVMCYQSISCMRQQMKPDWRVHGIFSKSGISPSIIPQDSEMQFYIRAPTAAEVEVLKKKVEACAHGAALMSGCEVGLKYDVARMDLITNANLASIYESKGVELGIEFSKDKTLARLMGSTDMGNVSYEVPSIHPLFDINTDFSNHTREFTDAAGSPDAQGPTLMQGKAMALTALHLMQPGNECVMDSIRQEFEQTVGQFNNATIS